MEIKSSHQSSRHARVFIVRTPSIILDKIVIVLVPELKTFQPANILSLMGNVDHKIGSWNFATPQHFHDFKLTKTDRRRISTRFSTLASQKGLSVWNQYSLFLYLFRNVSFHRQVLSGSRDKKVKADRRQTVTHSWSWCDPRQDGGWPLIGWLDQSRDWRLASYWLNHVRPEPGSLLRCRD